VYWPTSADEIAQIFLDAEAANVALIIYGAGSGVAGGARSVDGCWVIDTKRMNRIVEVDSSRWTVRVQAGVIGQHLEDYLQERGYTLGHSPSSIWCSTLGGWAAARGAGQFSSRYGVFEDMVISVTIVSPGEGVRTVDAQTPIELAMVLGSEGTLGVIVEMTLRVVAVAKKRWLRGYKFTSVETAVSAMNALMQTETWPSVVRLYDPVDTLIGGKTKPTRERTSPLTALAKRIPTDWAMRIPFSMPKLVNGLADLAAGECLLIVGYEGEPAVVEACSAAGHALLIERATDLGSEPGQRWFDSRHHVSFKLSGVFAAGAFADTMEVATTWSKLIGLYRAVRSAVAPHVIVMAHMSHVYPEGCSIYFTFAGWGTIERYDKTWKAALEAVESQGGTISHHHGVGILKKRQASMEIGASVAAVWERRGAADPNGRLGPDRLVEEVAPSVHHGEAWDFKAVDGLDKSALGAALPTGRARWPWEGVPLPGPQRWPWMSGYIGVRGTLDGAPVSLGRAPRSASGSDLRPWLVRKLAGQGSVSYATVDEESKQRMVKVPSAQPWSCVVEILRADFRPSVVGVEAGHLFIGFRGPASDDLARLVSSHLGATCVDAEWRDFAMPSAPIEACTLEDPRAIWATHQGCFRVEEAS
jgi:alkyldihydroxyacetonephosphate synthase